MHPTNCSIWGVKKSPPYGRAQRLTRPKRGILTTITHELKNFFDPFQSEERNEKWSHHRIFTSHLTWSCVFRRRQTYADVFRRVQTYSDVCRLTLTHWDVCRRTAAFNDSLHLGGQKISAVITIFKCWQMHEIHLLQCRVESEKVQKDDEHEVLSDAIEQHKTS